MNSKKIMLILLLLLFLLFCLFYYVFTSKKDPDFIDENNTKELIKKEELKKDENISILTSSTSDIKSKTSNFDDKRLKKEQNLSTKLEDKGSELKNEYESFLARSRLDKSLAEPRYDVYVLDSKALSKEERDLVIDIRKTLSLRGAYFTYSLFVEKLADEKLRLYIFNTSLLDNKIFEKIKPNALPNMLFKFNQHSVLSIKNSFYMRDFKSFLGQDAKIRAMHISGYTDENGSKAYNYALGLKRSAAVASEFLRQVAKIRLDSHGKDLLLSKNSYENRCASIVFM